jgi:glycosyltransferase involved in cell wall biosynthesis
MYLVVNCLGVNRDSPPLPTPRRASVAEEAASDFKVIAIVAAFNEEDVIGQVIGDLVEQGVSVYLLDNGSTDDTVARASPFLGRGLLRIEQFPGESADGRENASRFALREILSRKETLAEELDGNWFINADADEFRESPWAHLSLREAIREVDRLGYNAIDFELLNFWPTIGVSHPNNDVRHALRFYEFGQPWDKLQIRCWKKADSRVELVSSGGHDVGFPGRKVFPLRFILRHYPIRGQAHGERKVFQERRPRFDTREREGGWHVQYDRIQEGHDFLKDPTTLTAYDPHAIRVHLALRHRGVEELERTVASCEHVRDGLETELENRRQSLEDLQSALALREVELQRLSDVLRTRDGEIEQLRRALESAVAQMQQLRQTLESRDADLARLERTLTEREGEVAELDRAFEAARGDTRRLEATVDQLRAQLGAVAATRSWRWTAPLRRIWTMVFHE